MNTPLEYYIVNLGVGLGVIAVAASLLHKYGQAAMVHAYRGETRVANATVPLLGTVFCLMNAGFLFLVVNLGDYPATGAQLFNGFIARMAFVFFVIAMTLYGNLHYINETRREQQYAPPPKLPI